jgi:hypothetical protein
MWNFIAIRLETALVSVQDRCMFCVKRIIGTKSFRTHLMVHLGDQGQVDARFIPFGDSANLYLR